MLQPTQGHVLLGMESMIMILHRYMSEEEMAKVNSIGILGAAFCALSAGTFWLYVFIPGIGSGWTELELDMAELMSALAALYIIGTMIGIASQLGVILQSPSLLVGTPVAWYMGYSPLLLTMLFLGLLGTSLLILSMFIGHSRQGGLEVPPFSRLRTWSTGAGDPRARPLPKGAARVILAVVAACMVSMAAFAAYSWSNSVSTLRVQVLVDGATYGDTTVSVIIDGETVITSFLTYDPDVAWHMTLTTYQEVRAGTHVVEVDAWNTADLTQGTIDTRGEKRTLPFTTDDVYLGVGVGFI
jgi:hypothetical protein